MPTVSIIIPTYNRKEYLQEAIDSVLSQTYTDYEIIVVDDGSTDGTGETMQACYGEQVRYVWQENQGESVARNQGLALAKGDLIAFLDSDDLWVPEKLARQCAYLNTFHSDMIFTQAWIIDAQGDRFADKPLGSDKHLPTSLTPQDLYMANLVSGPSTVMIKREILQTIDGFDPEIKYGEDWDLWLQVAQIASIHNIAEPLACIRRHHGTQCYYPDSAVKIALVLSDHLRLLHKSFAATPTKPITMLQNRAIANQYLAAFVAEVHVGTVETAQGYLYAAQGYAPTMLSDMNTFGELIINQMLLTVESKQRSDIHNGLIYIDKIVGHLQDINAYESDFGRILRAKANATLGFWANQQWGKRAARQFFVNALREDITWARNTGIISVIVKSIFLRDEV